MLPILFSLFHEPDCLLRLFCLTLQRPDLRLDWVPCIDEYRIELPVFLFICFGVLYPVGVERIFW